MRPTVLASGPRDTEASWPAHLMAQAGDAPDHDLRRRCELGRGEMVPRRVAAIAAQALVTPALLSGRPHHSGRCAFMRIKASENEGP
jgi:hypothetical protein